MKANPNDASQAKCDGCGRTFAVDMNAIVGLSTLGPNALPHDEKACVLAHVVPVRGAARVRTPVRKVLPSRRYGERRKAWRARVGVL